MTKPVILVKVCIKLLYTYSWPQLISKLLVAPSGVARPKLMVGPDYRGTKEVLEDLALAAPGCESDRSIQQLQLMLSCIAA